jgi:hypothetical protein
MEEKINNGLYVNFNRLNKELNLFENRFYATNKKVHKNKDIQTELDKRLYAELWIYYNNLIDFIQNKVVDLETKMLETFPSDLESHLLQQNIPVKLLEKKVVYYPENKAFELDKMNVTEINKENSFLKGVE